MKVKIGEERLDVYFWPHEGSVLLEDKIYYVCKLTIVSEDGKGASIKVMVDEDFENNILTREEDFIEIAKAAFRNLVL